MYKPTAVVDEKLILVLATALSASLLFDHYVRKTFVYYSKGAGGQNTHKLKLVAKNRRNWKKITQNVVPIFYFLFQLF